MKKSVTVNQFFSSSVCFIINQKEINDIVQVGWTLKQTIFGLNLPGLLSQEAAASSLILAHRNLSVNSHT